MPYTCKECNTKNSHYDNDGGFCCAFCGGNGLPLDLPINFNYSMKKLIDLDDKTFKALSKLAIDDDLKLKNYIEKNLVLLSKGKLSEIKKINQS